MNFDMSMNCDIKKKGFGLMIIHFLTQIRYYCYNFIKSVLFFVNLLTLHVF